MKQFILKSLTVLLMATVSMVTVDAQKTMDVSKFTRLDNDLMARVTKPVRDQDEGKLCALIRVVTNLTDLEVRADALGIVQQEKHSGELWLYVPYGARSLSFAHEGYYPLLYQYAEKIEEGTVYELRLSSMQTTDAMAQNTNTQLFVLTHNPDDATVYIDDMEVKYNRLLNQLAQKAIIPHLTSYVARHSWASIAYSLDVALPIISKAMGHTSTQTTLTYIREINDYRIDEANKGIISPLLNR